MGTIYFFEQFWVILKIHIAQTRFLEDFEVICVSQIRLDCISMISVMFGVFFVNNNAYILQYIQDWRGGVTACSILQ